MGVMTCCRNYCQSIMCDTYIPTIGYICRWCQQEFKDYLVTKEISINTEGDINRELEIFMKTKKDSYTAGKELTIEEFFEMYTK